MLQLRDLGIKQNFLASKLHGPDADSLDLLQVFMRFRQTVGLAVLDDGDGLGDAYTLQLGLRSFRVCSVDIDWRG